MQYRYEQIADSIEQSIKTGDWSVGDKLPGEVEFCKKYNVGRSTIREALNVLKQKGIIVKKNGVGTFVGEGRGELNNPLLELKSIGQMIKNGGYIVGSTIHSVEHVIPNDILATKLNLLPDEKVVIVARERSAHQYSVAFAYNVFPEKIVGDLFDEGVLNGIFDTLKEKCKIEISYALSDIKGIDLKNEWDQKASEVLRGPIILMEQLHYDNKDQPIFYSYDYLRTDLVNLNLRRDR